MGIASTDPDVHIVHRGKAKRISEQERKQLRRRQAIEPIIGHLKADHRILSLGSRGRARVAPGAGC